MNLIEELKKKRWELRLRAKERYRLLEHHRPGFVLKERLKTEAIVYGQVIDWLNGLLPDELPAPPEFDKWLSDNYHHVSKYYYTKISSDTTYSIEEIRRQYVMDFAANPKPPGFKWP